MENEDACSKLLGAPDKQNTIIWCDSSNRLGRSWPGVFKDQLLHLQPAPLALQSVSIPSSQQGGETTSPWVSSTAQLRCQFSLAQGDPRLCSAVIETSVQIFCSKWCFYSVQTKKDYKSIDVKILLCPLSSPRQKKFCMAFDILETGYLTLVSSGSQWRRPFKLCLV